MQNKRYVLCGNASARGISEDPTHDLRLRLSGKEGKGNITLRIEDVHRKMFQPVPALFNDLLEIATYVYSADQVIRRGADDVDTFGDGWGSRLGGVLRRNREWAGTENEKVPANG